MASHRTPLAFILLTFLSIAGSSHAQTPTIPPVGVRGYVYVEPFEIRKEFVLPLEHLTGTLNLPADATLDEAARSALLTSLTERLSTSCPILAEGDLLQFELDRIEFVVVDPQKGVSPETREPVPVRSATVAAVFALTRVGPPTSLDITWDVFPDDKGEVPVALEASAGTSMEFFNHVLTFTPSNNKQTWDLPDIGAPPTLLTVSAPPGRSPLRSTGIGLALVLLAGVCFFIGKKNPDRRLRLAGAALAIAAIALFISATSTKNETIKNDDARAIVDALLHNIYHAFAYRDESRIFDTLATSVSGDLLEDLYLDIRGGLELENAGGPRVKIHKVVLGECVPDLSTPPGFRSSATWTAAGNVSHWGHIHPRRNKYRGGLTIEPIDGAWKVTDVQILEEERE